MEGFCFFLGCGYYYYISLVIFIVGGLSQNRVWNLGIWELGVFRRRAGLEELFSFYLPFDSPVGFPRFVDYEITTVLIRRTKERNEGTKERKFVKYAAEQSPPSARNGYLNV